MQLCSFSVQLHTMVTIAQYGDIPDVGLQVFDEVPFHHVQNDITMTALSSSASATDSKHWCHARMSWLQEQQPAYRPSQYEQNANEQQPTYRPSQYEQNTNVAGYSGQNNMDSQIPSDSADRQRNMASSNSAAASQSQRQQPSHIPQPNQSSQRGSPPQWSQQQRKWGSDVDLGSLEEWDSD